MASKKFYIFEVVSTEGAPPSSDPPYKFKKVVDGAVGDARGEIESLGTGRFLVLEDTSGIITVSKETTTKTVVKFDPPRKKERKVKAAQAAKATKPTPPAEKKPGVGA